MTKICPECDEVRKESDFIASNMCYKCSYEKKTKKDKGKAVVCHCRICGNPCAEHRWVYCSDGCSTIGELKQKKDYWTTKVPYL